MTNWYQEFRPVVDLGRGQRPGDGLQLFDAGIDFAGHGPRKLPPPPGMFSGWSPPVPLKQALTAQPGHPLHERRHRLYRLSLRGQRRPLYIGMTNKSVVSRLRAHLTGRQGGSRRLRLELQRLVVQHGGGFRGLLWVVRNVMLSIAHIVGIGQRVDMNLLHQYELNLQRSERPVAWHPDEWTFDEFMDFEDLQ